MKLWDDNMGVKIEHDFSDLDPELCAYCGTCVSVCPMNSLIAENEKIELVGECKSCGTCFDFCPGREVSFSKLNKYVFRKSSKGIIGVHKSIYVAHSKDANIRAKGSSGGVVTALLIYALEKKIIDGAIVVGMNKKEPWKYEIKIAKNIEEIIEAAQSKYAIVPLNSILRKLENETGNFAVVGLPCHIQGIRKLQFGSWENAKKIKLLIGLFCGFNLHFSATDYLINKVGVKKCDIKSLEYRGGDWPGGFLIKTKNGTEKFIKKFYYNFVNVMFVPKRCLLCADLMNELADISVGDAWLNDITDGWSTVIIRSENGRILFKEAAKHNYIDYKQITKEDILKSHSHLIRYKKRSVFVRLGLSKTKPIHDLKNPNLGLCQYVSGLSFFYLIKILSNVYIRSFICFFPLKLLGITAYLARWIMRKGDIG
jgi:coenzyme F420 hydrogenase subunit beta